MSIIKDTFGKKTTLTISSMQSHHAEAVADLHARRIATGFLSTLGHRFLTHLYKGIWRAPGSIIYVALNDSGSIAGFLAGTVNTHRMYQWIMKRAGFAFFALLLPRAFNSTVLLHIVETMLYTIKRTLHKPKKNGKNKLPLCAELLAIAVDEKSLNQHIGRQLIAHFESFLRQQGVNAYKVVTFSQDLAANAFYQKCGFTLHAQFSHHDHLMNEYCKTI